MKRNSFPTAIPLFFIVLASLASGCKRSGERAEPAPNTWTLPVMVASEGAPIVYAIAGSVVSDQRIDVASKLSGYILEILVREGDRVKASQVLARIDAADVDGGIRRAQAAVDAAEAASNDANTDMERFEWLFGRGSISENEMRKIRLKADTSREALNQAKAALDTALSLRAYADVTSPVDGVVVARIKRAGDLALPGAPILIVEAGGGLLFETFVAESQLAAIGTGDPVDVVLDGLPSPLKGTVSRVVPSGDPVTRSYQVKIALPETAGLMPGMFGRANFVVGLSEAPVVPKGALVERGGLRGVFVVDDEGRAHFRWLRIGREWPDRVEVDAGLRADERFVATVEPKLRDGDKIKAAESVR
ncbi:MAG: efflux RND transporter periplasmic adaptor subunit [Opitutales bacterium]|jgi:RND family efflux transporter MFP subunit